MTDIELYCSYAYNLEIFTVAAKSFKAIAGLIENASTHFLNVEAATQECMQVLRAIEINNILLQSKGKIQVSQNTNNNYVFEVLGHQFLNINEAIKAAEMKAIL